MRNVSRGAPLTPIPFEPLIPGLEVTESFKPLEIPVYTEVPVPAPVPPLQKGSVTLFFISVLLLVTALLPFFVDYDTPGRDERMADDIKACIETGGEPVVRGRVVRCAVRKAVQS